MIFRNSFRLFLTNFSNVWKVLLYYFICFLLTFCVCYYVALPIITKLSEAQVFKNLLDMLNSIFFKPENAISNIFTKLNEILTTTWEVLKTNTQFMFNYIFLIVWLIFVFPFTIDLAQLALGEVFYGYMTSHVKYGFTGRFIKNIGKSCVFSLSKYIVQFVFNVLIISLFVLIVKLFTIGNFLYVLLDLLLFALLIVFISIKLTLFSCWMPGIAVLNSMCFKSLIQNFKIVFHMFFKIFSNCLTLVLLAFGFNFLMCAYTFGVGLIVSLPMTAVVFVAFQMVTYFNCQGMRYYVYPDVFVSPKKFEEQDKISKMKYMI